MTPGIITIPPRLLRLAAGFGAALVRSSSAPVATTRAPVGIRRTGVGGLVGALRLFTVFLVAAVGGLLARAGLLDSHWFLGHTCE